jgi:[ribosomal protein S5]-alanine N-acetyltransferase
MDRGRRLETERLLLGRASWWDAVFVLRLIGSETVRQYLGGVVPARRRLSVMRSYLHLGADESIWTVRMKPRANPVGLVSVTRHKDGRDHELSYQFHPAAWGCGYAFEAGSAVLCFARDSMGLQKLIAETQAANLASCRLLERLGMVEHQRLQRFGAEQVLYQIDLRHRSARTTDPMSARD